MTGRGESNRGKSIHGNAGLVPYIGALKLFKGVVLAVVGIGALHLLHRDVHDSLARFATELHIDPQNHLLDRLLHRSERVNDHDLTRIGVVGFVYASLLITEGIGLLMRKRWAEYFAIITTSSLVPFEISHLVHRASPLRAITLVLNVVVVLYLVWKVQKQSREQAAA